MAGHFLFNSLESIEDAISKTGVDNNKDNRFIVDWLDLDDVDVCNSLQRFLYLRGKSIDRWEFVEIRECVGNYNTSMLIRWIIESSSAICAPIDVLSLVSIFNGNVAMTIQQCLSPNNSNTRDIDNNKQRPQIMTLEILGSSLVPMTLSLLFQGLSSNQETCTTESLSFSNSHFCDNSISHLAEGMIRCPSIVHLNLFSCNINDDEISELINVLRSQNHPLKQLDLGRNKCGSLAFRSLGDYLATTTELESLNLTLQHVEFDMQTLDMSPLFPALITNKSLKALYLRGNPIFDTLGNGSVLVQALTENDTLEKLMMTDCFLSMEVLESILSNLANFKGLRCLWLDGMQRQEISKRRSLARLATDGLRNNQNVTLEELHFPFSFTDFIAELHLFLDWNFGGRRLLLLGNGSNSEGRTPNSNDTIPSSLWPKVLERINRTRLPTRQRVGKRNVTDKNGNSIKEEEESIRRASMVYFMIRENSSLQTDIFNKIQKDDGTII